MVGLQGMTRFIGVPGFCLFRDGAYTTILLVFLRMGKADISVIVSGYLIKIRKVLMSMAVSGDNGIRTAILDDGHCGS